MKQVKLFFSIITFVFISILLSSQYEAQSDTDSTASKDTSAPSYRLKDFSLSPYLYGDYKNMVKLDYQYSGTEGTVKQQSSAFAKNDAIDEFNYRTLVIPKGGYGCTGIPESSAKGEKSVGERVDDLVDDYFDFIISYEELEYRLDELGYGLDPFFGPYPYTDYLYMDGKVYGCSPSRIRLQNIYSVRPYPETAGIQYDQFQLINPRYNQDA